MIENQPIQLLQTTKSQQDPKFLQKQVSKLQRMNTLFLHSKSEDQTESNKQEEIQNLITTIQNLKNLKQFSQFDNFQLDQSNLEKIYNNNQITLKTYRKNDIITEKGSHNLNFYIIIKGSVKIYLNTTIVNESIPVKKLQSQDGFNHFEVLYKNQSYFTRMASSETVKLLVFEREAFMTLFGTYFKTISTEIQSILTNIYIFQNLNYMKLLQIVTLMQEDQLIKNCTLYKQNDEPLYMYKIQSGQIMIFEKEIIQKQQSSYQDPTTSQINKYQVKINKKQDHAKCILEEGQVFGYQDFFPEEKEQRIDYAVVNSATATVFKFHKNYITKLLQENEEIQNVQDEFSINANLIANGSPRKKILNKLFSSKNNNEQKQTQNQKNQQKNNINNQINQNNDDDISNQNQEKKNTIKKKQFIKVNNNETSIISQKTDLIQRVTSTQYNKQIILQKLNQNLQNFQNQQQIQNPKNNSATKINSKITLPLNTSSPKVSNFFKKIGISNTTTNISNNLDNNNSLLNKNSDNNQQLLNLKSLQTFERYAPQKTNKMLSQKQLSNSNIDFVTTFTPKRALNKNNQCKTDRESLQFKDMMNKTFDKQPEQKKIQSLSQLPNINSLSKITSYQSKNTIKNYYFKTQGDEDTIDNIEQNDENNSVSNSSLDQEVNHNQSVFGEQNQPQNFNLGIKNFKKPQKSLEKHNSSIEKLKIPYFSTITLKQDQNNYDQQKINNNIKSNPRIGQIIKQKQKTNSSTQEHQKDVSNLYGLENNTPQNNRQQINNDGNNGYYFFSIRSSVQTNSDFQDQIKKVQESTRNPRLSSLNPQVNKNINQNFKNRRSQLAFKGNQSQNINSFNTQINFSSDNIKKPQNDQKFLIQNSAFTPKASTENQQKNKQSNDTFGQKASAFLKKLKKKQSD